MAYTALAYSYWASFHERMDAYVTPTNYTNYSCHIKAVELIQPIVWGLRISHHITLLVINSIGGGHTHKHTHIDVCGHKQF